MLKRTFNDLRTLILETLSQGQMTVNELSTKSGINWKTVDNHLIFLVGKGYVRTVFASRYVKIYEITEEGRALLGKEEVLTT